VFELTVVSKFIEIDHQATESNYLIPTYLHRSRWIALGNRPL